MDRLTELRSAYAEALAAGEALLELLRSQTPEPPVEQIQQLLERRQAAVQVAVSWYQPGDQVPLRDQLESLVAQQKALETELDRVMGDLRRQLQEVESVRAAARRSRRVMDAGNRGSLLDQRQ